MATSLARQLQQLKTPATSAIPSGASASLFSSGPFIIEPEAANTLDERQLELIADESFRKICFKCEDLSKYESRIFEDNSAMETTESDEPWQEDVMLLLTPYALTPEGQFVLQWLISKHRVQATHPEGLLWSTMPFYEYKIFHRVVDSIAVLPSTKYPKWFLSFKQSCHPATQIGMHKHLAKDGGFFKLVCDRTLNTLKHQRRFSNGATYDEIIFFVCSSMLNALKICSHVSENQLYNLLQVIVAGLKSDHKEFHALGTILMARILPAVKLKAKVANRLLKVLNKLCRKRGVSENTLSSLLILFRTQSNVIDHLKVIALLLKHSNIVNDCFSSLNKDEEDIAFSKRVFHCLTLLCESIASTEIVDEDVSKVFDLFALGLRNRDTWNRDTLILGIQALSKANVHYKALKKKLKAKKKLLVKELFNQTKDILSTLKELGPEEYLHYSIVPLNDIVVTCDDSKENANESVEKAKANDKTPEIVETVKKPLSFEEQLIEFHMNEVEYDGDQDDFYVNNCCLYEGREISVEMVLYILDNLISFAESSKNSARKMVSTKSDQFPKILTILTHGERKAKKKVLKLFDHLVTGSSAGSFIPMINYILEEREEILAHSENIERIAEQYLKANKTASLMVRNLLNAIIASSDNGKLFGSLCVFFKGLSVRSDLETVATFAVDMMNDEEESHDEMLEMFVRHLSSKTIAHIESPLCQKLFQEALNTSKTIKFANIEQKLRVLMLQHFDVNDISKDNGTLYAFFSLLIDVIQDCEDTDVLSEIRGIIQKMPLETKMFEQKLSEVWRDHELGNDSITSVKRRKSLVRKSEAQDISLLSLEMKWKKSVFLLENMAGFQSCSNQWTPTVLHDLFNLLKIQNETSDENAYITDLVLTCILKVVEEMGEDCMASLDDHKAVKPELLVQCIQKCKNPNTKSTALLILAKASSACTVEYILQNCIMIFTFMGDYFMRAESQHSFEVACRAIDIIIPHIQNVCKKKGPNMLTETNFTICTTFADASIDMTPHRFRTFLKKLVHCLGEMDNLWFLTLMLLRTVGKKKQSLDSSGESKTKGSGKSGHHKNLQNQMIAEMFCQFDAKVQLQSILRMMMNMKTDSPENRKLLRVSMEKKEGNDAFNTLKIRMLSFCSNIVHSDEFLDSIQNALIKGDDIKTEMQLLVECAILYIDLCDKMSKNDKIFAYFVHFSEKILEGSLSVLPSNLFVDLLKSFLKDNKEVVRRKALEIFNIRLQQKDAQIKEDENVTSLIEPLVNLAKGRLSSEDDPGIESTGNQQLALLVIRSFSKCLGENYPGEFKQVCNQLSKKPFLNSLTNPGLISSTLLCLTELTQSIGPHAVSSLPSLVKWILDIMTNDIENVANNVILLNSLVLAVQKLMTNFGGFLNPYFKNFVIATCSLMSIQQKSAVGAATPRHEMQRIRNLQTAMATGIPTHGMVSICRQCFDEMSSDPQSLIALAHIIKDNLQPLDKAQALVISGPYMEFFQKVFTYRQTHYEKDLAIAVTKVEGAFIEAFLTLTLKLALDDFQPLFYRIFSSTTMSTDEPKVLCTRFHVAFLVAQKLKSLFDFALEMIVQSSTNILNKFAESNYSAFKASSDEPELLAEMFYFILDALSVLFSNTRVESLLEKQYEDHVNALLPYLEAPFQEESLQEKLLAKMGETLTQLASSTEDETQWKYLNYQVLIALRNPSSDIRFFVLSILSRFVEVKGESYLTVLPDAVPFMCELLEDEPELEKACKELIQKMEDVFGQSIQSYFE